MSSTLTPSEFANVAYVRYMMIICMALAMFLGACVWAVYRWVTHRRPVHHDSRRHNTTECKHD